jgi:hypothetical protein
MLDHWMLDGLVAGMTPLAHLENLPCPHMILLDAPAFLLSLSQTSSNIWFRDRKLAPLQNTHRRLLTEERFFSPAYYYTVGTSGNAVQCHIISVVLCINYLQTSLFITPYQTLHL